MKTAHKQREQEGNKWITAGTPTSKSPMTSEFQNNDQLHELRYMDVF